MLVHTYQFVILCSANAHLLIYLFLLNKRNIFGRNIKCRFNVLYFQEGRCGVVSVIKVLVVIKVIMDIFFGSDICIAVISGIFLLKLMQLPLTKGNQGSKALVLWSLFYTIIIKYMGTKGLSSEITV